MGWEETDTQPAPDTAEVIELYNKLDDTDKGAALERMRIMLEGDKYK
ncbi:MAG: hypothetical protein LUG85_02160 [Clostridiales bacterium]|nr:hypothetical protein [Clostridiales bacterium]